MRPIDDQCAECGQHVALADSHHIIVIYWSQPARAGMAHVIKRLHDRCIPDWDKNTSDHHDLFPPIPKA